MFETTIAYEADVATGDTTINNGTMFFLLSPVGSPVPQSIVSLGATIVQWLADEGAAATRYRLQS